MDTIDKVIDAIYDSVYHINVFETNIHERTLTNRIALSGTLQDFYLERISLETAARRTLQSLTGREEGQLQQRIQDVLQNWKKSTHLIGKMPIDNTIHFSDDTRSPCM